MLPFSLRFVDPHLERHFQERYFADSLPYIRLAHIMGIAVWIIFGILAQLTIDEGTRADLIIRFGIGIPIAVISLGLTYAHWYERFWQIAVSATILLSGVVWSLHRIFVVDVSREWGYVGIILIQAFCYVLARIQIRYSVVAGAALIASYNIVSIGVSDGRYGLLFADFFLFAFAGVGMAAGYGLERSTRLLFLRERQLDRERARADELLRNTLPDGIVDRLQASQQQPEAVRIADGFEQVTVLFADLVGFTEHAGRTPPGELVEMLDDVFTRFDELAARVGMEKIKTVGDAYMAAAGAPRPQPDHAHAAAEMALGILSCIRDARWPTGESVSVRIGLATGPVIAGVIGRHRFAYDLWGDTVNLASRLESHGEPDGILVSEDSYSILRDTYRFSEARTLVLKGKGPTAVRFLLGGREVEGDQAESRSAR
jgi:class 3 adenylate cyclase